MTGEELNRKYWELCGWQILALPENGSGLSQLRRWCKVCGDFREVPHWIMPDGKHDWRKHKITETQPEGPPKLHLDANLAIAEAEKVFEGNWQLHVQPPNAASAYFADDVHGFAQGEHAVCEAILKAIIAAKKQGSHE